MTDGPFEVPKIVADIDLRGFWEDYQTSMLLFVLAVPTFGSLLSANPDLWRLAVNAAFKPGEEQHR